MHKPTFPSRARSFFLALSVLLLLASCPQFEVNAQAAGRTPSETVHEFYRLLRERRFQDAFALSIFSPAVESLSREDYEELRPDFERMAEGVPARVDVTGEQIGEDAATVFLRTAGDGASASVEPVMLMRRASDNNWIVGDRENAGEVIRQGKNFFFNARIETHHGEAQKMMARIAAAQLAYSRQHSGAFADLPALVSAGLLPKDVETAGTAGYRFRVTLAPDKRGYAAGAEPARYNRTGRLSFYMNAAGIQTKDTGGKPYNPAQRKQ